jgi:hypothetical protein
MGYDNPPFTRNAYADLLDETMLLPHGHTFRRCGGCWFWFGRG